MTTKLSIKKGLIPLLLATLCVLGNVGRASSLGVNVEITPHCSKTAKVCKFTWTLSKIYTMMLYNNKDGKASPIVEKDGRFQKRLNCNQYQNATLKEMDEINLASGYPKFIYAVNGQIPGPSMVVYENQTIEVTVINNIESEGTGIHWHGMYQKGTPWMDGVTSVSQCDINYGERFVYRFRAEPQGTHWYHSHTGLQRSDGLFGALIVLPKEEPQQSPVIEKDFVMVFHDWHPLPSTVDYHTSVHHFQEYLQGFNASTCSDFETSTIINGKGLLDQYLDDPKLNTITTYPVVKGKSYRMRFINTGYDSPYLIQIEKHEMAVIASDGSPLQPFPVDGVYIHIGERYDVIIQANQVVDNYWITLTDSQTKKKGYALLQYEGANTDAYPQCSDELSCNGKNPCRIANCPKKEFNLTSNFQTNCINIGEMQSSGQYYYYQLDLQNKEPQVEEHFLVLDFTEAPDGGKKASINGIHFIVPSKPPQVYREEDFDRPCNRSQCEKGPCRCTHTLNITRNNTIQFVIASKAGVHPMHFHGHDFDVLKVGYGDGGLNPDLKCQKERSGECIEATWADPSWAKGNIPGLNTINPPEKDVLMVPDGGYVVIRFAAKNPGWWMLHCHIEKHQAEGMMLIVREGQNYEMTPPPPGFPRCGSFEYDSSPDTGFSTEESNEGSGSGAKFFGFTVLGLVVGLAAGLVIPPVIRKIRGKRTHGNEERATYVPTETDPQVAEEQL